MPVQHPNVHQPWQKWSEQVTLHIAAPYSNPFRWTTRRKLFNDFAQQMRTTKNVALHVGELAYGDRPFEVSTKNDAQFRTTSELFHKENIINEIVETFPSDWQYGGYCDGDFTFTRNDWALEAIHLLQHYDFVQLFSTYSDLTAVGYGGSQPSRISQSFIAKYIANGYKLPPSVDAGGWGVAYGYGYGSWSEVGATGGAWAFRRSAFETVGGLLDPCILGHADWFMAFGLVSQPIRGSVGRSIIQQKYHPHYIAAIQAWQSKAALLKQNISVVDQFAVHHFHGSKKNRGYQTRDQILVKYQFDPVADLRRNAQGIYELTGNKPGLRDAIRGYFISRSEDDPTP
jgi:hypothetical protein